jgi:hypothetical protein
MKSFHHYVGKLSVGLLYNISMFTMLRDEVGGCSNERYHMSEENDREHQAGPSMHHLYCSASSRKAIYH